MPSAVPCLLGFSLPWHQQMPACPVFSFKAMALAPTHHREVTLLSKVDDRCGSQGLIEDARWLCVHPCWYQCWSSTLSLQGPLRSCKILVMIAVVMQLCIGAPWTCNPSMGTFTSELC